MRRRKDSVSDWERWEGQGEAEQGRKRMRFLGWDDRHKLITDRTYHWIESNGGSSRRHKKCGWWWNFQNNSPRHPSLMKGAPLYEPWRAASGHYSQPLWGLCLGCRHFSEEVEQPLFCYIYKSMYCRGMTHISWRHPWVLMTWLILCFLVWPFQVYRFPFSFRL